MTRVKYPRTPHVPWSPGASDDDVRTLDVGVFEDREVVVTEKLDGENTTLYTDGSHARSLDSAHHPSRAHVKALQARLAPSIPDGWRVCGENLFARHSIPYDALDAWFVAFSVWDHDRCLPWDDTVRFAHERGLPVPPVLWRGRFDRRVLRRLQLDPERQEGWVVRTVDGFPFDGFEQHVAKWVRPSHVRTDAHWMLQEVVPNGLGPDAPLWEIRSGGRIDPEALAGLVGGAWHVVDVPALGDRRLAPALAGRLVHRSRGELLPELVERFGLPLGRAVADLVGLQGLLTRAEDLETRPLGLATLARRVDLLGLHGVAEACAEHRVDPVSWSRLVAEEEGLLDADPYRAFREALANPDPDVAAFRLGNALDRRVAGELRSPEEAVAATWGQRPTGRLTVLVGPSGSGKSTLAASLGRPVVELDALREHHEDALTAGLARLDALRGDAVWDATSLTRTQRDLPIAVGRRHGCLIELVGVLTPRATAERRNRARARTVPADVVARQWARLSWPYADEGHIVRFVTHGEGRAHE